MDLLIGIAYNVDQKWMVGVPNWLGSERYDVTAKAEDGVILDCEQRSLRLRQLLQKRFRLAVHHDTKIVDGYALVVAKGGPKLQRAEGESTPGVSFPKGMRLQGVSMATFAAMLAHPLDRPVADKTGIDGTYDISLDYAPDGHWIPRYPRFSPPCRSSWG